MPPIVQVVQQRARGDNHFVIGRVVVVEGAGHMVPVERPEEFVHTLGTFWS